MEIILQILAAALLITAAYFLWNGATDWSFICGVLAACSFFLSMRFQIKARMAERAAAQTENYTADEPALNGPIDNTSADRPGETSPNSTLQR